MSIPYFFFFLNHLKTNNHHVNIYSFNIHVGDLAKKPKMVRDICHWLKHPPAQNWGWESPGAMSSFWGWEKPLRAQPLASEVLKCVVKVSYSWSQSFHQGKEKMSEAASSALNFTLGSWVWSPSGHFGVLRWCKSCENVQFFCCYNHGKL